MKVYIGKVGCEITKIPFLCSLLVGICCIQSLIMSCEGGRVHINSHVSVNPVLKVKAVNLGGWLVTEGWIKPSLFDGIPNKDLLVCTSLSPLYETCYVSLTFVNTTV